MTKEELEKEAKQSYLDNTYEMQWGAEGDFDYTRGYIAGAEPREKRIAELEKQVEILTKELDEYKSIDKRLICNHKYFTSDTKNNNLAVICHSILSCDMCGRWEEK